MSTHRNASPARRLTRREALAASAVAGAGLGAAVLLRGGPGRALAAAGTAVAAPGCVLTPEQTEGPYYIDGALVRRTITERKAGVPLALRYFRDATTQRIYTRTPYRAHGEPDTTNRADNIYADGGSKSLLALRRRGSGYVGRLTMGVHG
jgi:hypothetical protein